MKRITFDGLFCDIATCKAAHEDCPHGICSQRQTWERLKLLEDVLGDNYDLDRLRELVQADREGRANILPSPRENTCGKCGNFTRTPGCGYGECTLRPGLRPYQSRAKCKRYTEKALEEMEGNGNG